MGSICNDILSNSTVRPLDPYKPGAKGYLVFELPLHRHHKKISIAAWKKALHKYALHYGEESIEDNRRFISVALMAPREGTLSGRWVYLWGQLFQERLKGLGFSEKSTDLTPFYDLAGSVGTVAEKVLGDLEEFGHTHWQTRLVYSEPLSDSDEFVGRAALSGPDSYLRVLVPLFGDNPVILASHANTAEEALAAPQLVQTGSEAALLTCAQREKHLAALTNGVVGPGACKAHFQYPRSQNARAYLVMDFK